MNNDLSSFASRGVSKTLVLPLWGRARELQKKKPMLFDRKAAEIVEQLDYDFASLDTEGNRINQLAWVARACNIDREIRKFQKSHDNVTILNLGCGLDTTFERVDDGKMLWYDVDLPEVMTLRRRFLQETGRRRFVSGSVLDPSTLSGIDAKGSVLIVAAGLLYYFEEADVRHFLSMIQERFPGSEMLFDACSAMGVRLANKRVIADNRMDDSAQLRWAMENPKEMLAWRLRIRILSSYPLFRKMYFKIERSMLYTALLSDWLKIMYMVHIRFH